MHRINSPDSYDINLPIEGLNHRNKEDRNALLIMWFRLKVANMICNVVRLVRFWTVLDITRTVIGKLLLICLLFIYFVCLFLFVFTLFFFLILKGDLVF